MRVKKTRGKIYGAEFTASEQKAIDLEIDRQFRAHDKKHAMEISSMCLWILHEEFGWGPKRLKEFHHAFSKNIDALVARYELDDDDNKWLCTHKLKEYGIDLEEWEREIMP